MAVMVDPDLWRMIAAMLAPPERLKPSEWAEKYRVLKDGTTPQPGRWRNDYFPWLRPIMDSVVENPEKRGWLFQKSTQVGGDEGAVNVVGWGVCSMPCPMLYVASDDRQAREFSLDRFEVMIETAPVLKKRFFRGREHHELILIKRFVGGKLALYGSGSPHKLMSEPYRIVLLSEVDQLPTFPGVGSAWSLAQSRTAAYDEKGLIFGWSTPTIDDRGISVLMERLSDQRRFFIDCPHCKDEFWLKFGQVRIDGRRPETARYECEYCGKIITDTQRSAAVMAGRFKSVLSPEEAARRPFAGFYISRLYNPRLPLSMIAELYLSCQGEDDLQGFFNQVLGEPYTPAARPVTDELIERRAQLTPGDPPAAETRFLTAGVDVQAGDNFFVDVSGWMPGGLKHLLQYRKIQGWERLEAFLKGYTVSAGGRDLRIRMAAIDSQYLTTKVYAFCKKVGTQWVTPVRYQTVPPGEFSKRQLIQTANIWIYKLARAYWMDRAIGRFAGEGEEDIAVLLPVGISDEYKAHVLANASIETIDRFGARKLTWKKDKQARDDFLQAAAYCEFAASLLGLDSLEPEMGKIQERRKKSMAQTRPEVSGDKGFISRRIERRLKGGGWWG